MSDVSIPFGFDEDGNVVFPSEAERGKTYRCFGCENVRVFAVMGELVAPHMRAVKGFVHTGPLCKHLNDRHRKGRPPLIELVDKSNLARNIMRDPEPKTPPGDGPKNPRPPKKDPKKLVVCTSLPRIREHKLYLREDFPLGNGEMFSTCFVSLINAHVIMNDNASLNLRGLEAMPDYAFPHRRAIRFVQKARRFQNGKRTAAQKVLDMEFRTEEQFLIAFNLLFIRNPDKYSKRRYLPRYSKVFIFGIWRAVVPDMCRWNNECKKKCEFGLVHCTGRQVSEGMNALTQINVDDADLIHYDFMT